MNLIEKNYQLNESVFPKRKDACARAKMLVARLQEYMLRDRNFANPELNVDQVAKDLKVSRTYLYKKVKENTGLTLQDYINSMRLEDACRLLSASDTLVENVANMCGFNKSTFYRLFREKYNITPAEYRKMCMAEKGLSAHPPP